MRDTFLFLNIFIALALLFLGIISIINDKKSLINRVFFLFSISVGIWLVAACVSNDVRFDASVSLYGNYLVFLFSYFSSYFLLRFAALMTQIKRVRAIMNIVNIPLILIGLISSTPLVVSGVERQGEVYAVNFGPLVILYIILLVLQLFASLAVFIRGFQVANKREKSQIRIILLSLFIAIPILIITQFVAPAITGSFQITDLGILIMVLPVVGLYLSVIRHGLFDIKIAVVRTTTYALSLVALVVCYYFLAFLISGIFLKTQNIINPLNIILAIVLAFLFRPIVLFFNRNISKIIYRDYYDIEDFVSRLNQALSTTSNLKLLLGNTATTIAETLKSSEAFFFIYTDDDHYVCVGTSRHRKFPKKDADQLLQAESIKNGALVAAMNISDKDDQTRRLMISHRIEIVLPLKHSGKTLGFLCLGDRIRHNYAGRDLQVLEAISGDMVVAIQNALFSQKIRDFNDTLQQQINNTTRELHAKNLILRRLDKTKDEFVSIASHRLRTPLTSVKGNLSMLLDGDAGKLSDIQQQMLGSAFDRSEQMVVLIEDFLNITRIQTGHLEINKQQNDLVELVRQEIMSLESNASQHHIKLEFHAPTDFPKISFDHSKIRQVVMNFTDNAIYYSPDESVIEIKLAVEGNDAIFTVKDNGIGVPKSEQGQLFSKFFRADNARQKRPDGTGVGLYLAKKIITEHGGKIIFSSVQNQGSTFGFRLPLEAAS